MRVLRQNKRLEAGRTVDSSRQRRIRSGLLFDNAHEFDEPRGKVAGPRQHPLEIDAVTGGGASGQPALAGCCEVDVGPDMADVDECPRRRLDRVGLEEAVERGLGHGWTL